MGNDQSRGGGGPSPQSHSPGGASSGGGAPPAQAGAAAAAAASAARAAILAPRAPRDPLYHMKLVVRGKRGVGKTSLLCRLRGLPFPQAYQGTPEIQMASIAWQYKNMDDKIEVEVWDVVDRARAPDQAGGAGDDDDDAPAGACQPRSARRAPPWPLLALPCRRLTHCPNCGASLPLPGRLWRAARWRRHAA
jgi:hypothetical protein